MLAKFMSKPFSGKDWIFETKWDGFRAIAYVKDDLFTIQSRNGNEFKFNFPEVEEITHFAKTVVVDGEIVIMKNGKTDFQDTSFQILLEDIEVILGFGRHRLKRHCLETASTRPKTSST